MHLVEKLIWCRVCTKGAFGEPVVKVLWYKPEDLMVAQKEKYLVNHSCF